MTGKVKPDEKLCPFCAEVIKAAAIKCRYCGSELPAEPSAESSADVPESAAEPSPEPSLPDAPETLEPAIAEAPELPPGEPADDSASPGLSAWMGQPLTAVLLVLLIAVLVLGSVLVGHAAWNSRTAGNGQIVSEGARSSVLDEASRATATVLSYKAATFDADSKKAEGLMTASMKAQYLSTLDKVRANVSQYGLNLTAKVAGIGLVSATESKLTALAFVNQTTTAKGSKNTQVDQNRALVTMVKTADGWRISDIAPF